MRPALIALALVLALPLPAAADAFGQGPQPAAPVPPGDKLKEARTLFASKDFAGAADVLSALLYPREQLALPSELVEAHLLLGASFVETGRPGEAKDEFKQVLHLEPQKTLDATVFSPKVIRLFDETKSDLAEQQRKLEEERRKEEERRSVEDYLKSLRPFEVHPYWENLLPFGFSQFLEHRPGWGAAFLTSEGLSVAVSGGIWLYLAGKYGIVSNNVPREDVQTVRDLQTVEIVSGAAFFLLYGIGVYDSVRHYRPRVMVQGDESLLPPDLKPPPPKKTSLLDRIHILPMAVRGGAGIAIGWENP